MTEATPRAVLRTPLGDIVIELFAAQAPVSCADFLQRDFQGAGFYRVVDASTDTAEPPISIVQAGVLGGEPARGIAHEPTTLTGLSHRNGSVSIARAALGSGSTAAFFICIGEQPELDAGGSRHPDGFGFAAFAAVVDGMDIVRSIHDRPTDAKGPDSSLDGQMMQEPVPITSVERMGG